VIGAAGFASCPGNRDFMLGGLPQSGACHTGKTEMSQEKISLKY
jgi:hypothetical protein